MTLSLIVAMTEERVIGRNNKLPWHISDDLKRFKAITMGHPVIMGRKTYDSIGKPLPGRKNIVLSKDPKLKIEGVTVVGSFEQAVKEAGDTEAFVIGGSSLFEKALPLIDRLYLTLIFHKFPGDVYFPPIDLKKDFEILEETRLLGGSQGPYPFSFITAVPRR